MEAGECYLGGAGQVQTVALESVEVRLLGRQEPRAVHRLLPRQHGRQHDLEPQPDEMIEGVPIHRKLQQGSRPAAVGEARPGQLRPPIQIETPQLHMILSREVKGRRLADPADLDGIVVGVAVGDVVGRRVRDSHEQCRPASLDVGQLGLGCAELLLDGVEGGELRLAGFPFRAGP